MNKEKPGHLHSRAFFVVLRHKLREWRALSREWEISHEGAKKRNEPDFHPGPSCYPCKSYTAVKPALTPPAGDKPSSLSL